MTTEHNLISSDASLAEAAEAFLSTEADTLWVCEEGRPVGALTTQELLRAFVRGLDATATRVTEVMQGEEHFAPKCRSKTGPGGSSAQGFAVTDRARLLSSGAMGTRNVRPASHQLCSISK